MKISEISINKLPQQVKNIVFLDSFFTGIVKIINNDTFDISNAMTKMYIVDNKDYILQSQTKFISLKKNDTSSFQFIMKLSNDLDTGSVLLIFNLSIDTLCNLKSYLPLHVFHKPPNSFDIKEHKIQNNANLMSKLILSNNEIASSVAKRIKYNTEYRYIIRIQYKDEDSSEISGLKLRFITPDSFSVKFISPSTFFIPNLGKLKPTFRSENLYFVINDNYEKMEYRIITQLFFNNNPNIVTSDTCIFFLNQPINKIE
ncbi:MAG: hypothetical protein IPO62_17745 [Saprospiraceae bacterium]|nr:hypothetical protein [Saprospiraceae bacterium]